MTASEAYAFAAARAKELSLSLREFNTAVLFITVDSYEFHQAAMAEFIDPFWFVYTDHHGYRVEHKDEVIECVTYDRRASR